MYAVIQPDRDALIEAGYASVAHVPFLLAFNGYYPAEANRYLRARALCEWTLRMGNDSPPSKSRRRFLTAQSCLAMAKRLACFLRWCESTERDWRTVTYREDLLAWQTGLFKGTASESGKPLTEATTNNLVAEACYFLTWAAEVPREDLSGDHLREGFEVPTNPFSFKVGKGQGAKTHHKDVDARVGALVPRPSKLHLPSPREVGPWMRALRVRSHVKAMMSELILETGIRISECNQWRVDTLPPPDKWKVRAGKVAVEIKHGNKGRKITPDSTEAVKPRDVLVPLNLAERMDHYREITRPNQLRLWIKSGKTKEERDRRSRAPKPLRLWLSETTHQPFANVQLYRAWTQAEHCPDGWHPHAGREYFAVEMVVEWVRNDLESRHSNRLPDLTWLQGAMRDQVRLILTPLLGHVDEETTMKYLRAAHVRLVEEFGHPALRWQQYCDADDFEE